MSSGAHTHDTSGKIVQDQLYYHLPAQNFSFCVYFVHVGKDLFDLYFLPTIAITPAMFYDPHNMIYKVPQGYSASFKLTEVATGAAPADEGKYLIEMELHPAYGAMTMKKMTKEMFEESCARLKDEIEAKKITFTDLPAGFCTGEGECLGTYGPCKFGEVVRKVDGDCKCTSPGGGGDAC